MSKKIISGILVLCMILSCFGFSFAVSAESSVPIVYVGGQGAELYAKDGSCVYTGGRVPIGDLNIAETAKEIIPLLIGAVTLGQWDKYRTAVLNMWNPIYEKLRLDENCEPSNGTHIVWSWNPDNLVNDYNMHAYFFWYDWRLDPFTNAEDLNRLIEAVKEKTGSSKVNLTGRCEGCTVVLAYLAQYGYEDINCIGLYVSSINNIDDMGALFSGEVYLDPVILQRYYKEKVNIADNELSVLLDATVNYLVETYGLEGACKLLNKAMPKLFSEIGYDLILSSYGNFPGMWANIGSEYYEKARKNVFAGKEKEYAGLIEKIDNYDVKVRQRIDDILLGAKAAGINVGVFTKYGEFAYSIPVCKEGLDLNDGMCCLPCESFGATCSKMDSALSKDYLEKADWKYISPDKRVDASTCLFPDTTWFNYNSSHKDFNDQTHVLIKWFFDNNGEVTVFSDSAFPQYYVIENNSIRAMAEDDVTVKYIKDETPRLFRIIREFNRLLSAVFNYIVNLIKK